MSVAPAPEPDNLHHHAHAYATAGLDVFPVNPRDKTPLESQYKATTNPDQIDTWWHRWPTALIGHRIAPDVVVLDIDPRHQGDTVWRALLAEFPARPVTRWHRSGRGDGGGHTWWHRPADKTTVTKLDTWARERGLGHEVLLHDGTPTGRWTCGIDILHHNHRYTILPPSPHPDTGRPYTWATGGLDTPVAPMPALLADLITLDQLPPAPALPPRPPDPDSIADWYSNQHTWTALLSAHGWTLRAGDGNTDGSRWRHPTATSAFSATIRHNCLFVYSPNTPFDLTSSSDPHGYTLFRAYAILEHHGDLTAAGRAARETKNGPPANVDDWLASLPTAATPPQVNAAAAASAPAGAAIVLDTIRTGGDWILDAPEGIPAVWGDDEEVLWAEGESLLIAAPPGVGKTTLAIQLTWGRLGLTDNLLGYPITPTDHKILYLAMDRPRQIQRAMGRLARPEHRDTLNQKLAIRPGPPPNDLAKHPETLTYLAQLVGADTVIIDSLKDAAIGLSDDEVGSGLNRAIQTALAEDIEVLCLHHQRKGQNGTKPKSLEDVYGSTWIASGAGSVVLLWGAAGDSLVELVHLKQPGAAVGPLKIEHDHPTGTTRVTHGFDLLAYLRTRPAGVTSRDAAHAKHGREPNQNQIAAVRGALNRLVAKGHAVKEEGDIGGSGGSDGSRWRPVDKSTDWIG